MNPEIYERARKRGECRNGTNNHMINQTNHKQNPLHKKH